MLNINEQIEKYKQASKSKKDLAEIFSIPKQQHFRDTLLTNAEELDSIVCWLEELIELRKLKMKRNKKCEN